jgi:hypothetical protein
LPMLRQASVRGSVKSLSSGYVVVLSAAGDVRAKAPVLSLPVIRKNQ